MRGVRAQRALSPFEREPAFSTIPRAVIPAISLTCGTGPSMGLSRPLARGTPSVRENPASEAIAMNSFVSDGAAGASEEQSETRDLPPSLAQSFPRSASDQCTRQGTEAV